MNDKAQFDDVKWGGCRGVVRRDWKDRLPPGPELIELVWGDTSEVVRAGETGKGIEGRTTARDFDGQRVYCKIYLADRIHRHFADWIGRSRSMEEWRVNCEAHRRGVPTAPIIAAMTMRRGLRFFHLICLLPAPGIAAASWLRREKDPERRLACVREMGEVLARAHKAGFFHEHFAPKHVFTDLEGNVQLIDLERGLFADPLPDKLAFRNLRQMLTATAKGGSEEEVRALYTAYKQNDPGCIKDMDHRAENVIKLGGKKVRKYQGY